MPDTTSTEIEPEDLLSLLLTRMRLAGVRCCCCLFVEWELLLVELLAKNSRREREGVKEEWGRGGGAGVVVVSIYWKKAGFGWFQMVSSFGACFARKMVNGDWVLGSVWWSLIVVSAAAW